MADLSDAIEEAATGPKSATFDGQTVVARDIDELIKAEQHLNSQDAATVKGFGLRYQKIVPPAAG